MRPSFANGRIILQPKHGREKNRAPEAAWVTRGSFVPAHREYPLTDAVTGLLPKKIHELELPPAP